MRKGSFSRVDGTSASALIGACGVYSARATHGLRRGTDRVVCEELSSPWKRLPILCHGRSPLVQEFQEFSIVASMYGGKMFWD